MAKDESEYKLGLQKWNLSGITKDRLTFFSDAIFAIAITLLALDIRIVDIQNQFVSEQLKLGLYELIPNIIGFTVSFWIIANFWIKYHRIMGLVKDCDGKIIYLNLLFLMFIALLPFPHSLLGRYPTEQLVIILYTIIIFITGSIPGLIWIYASKNHRLIDSSLNQRFIGHVTVRAFLSPLVFILAIPFSYYNTYISMFIWFLALPFGSITEIYFKRK